MSYTKIYDSRFYNKEYITMWEVIINNEKYLCDKNHNIYSFDNIKPKYLGKMTLDNKIKEIPINYEELGESNNEINEDDNSTKINEKNNSYIAIDINNKNKYSENLLTQENNKKIDVNNENDKKSLFNKDNKNNKFIKYIYLLLLLLNSYLICKLLCHRYLL